ncbi:acyl-CoA dehydrogenase [Moorena producens PAL-8-15-08-1]|uniref:Acyl-CoA dehydrogenase n=1 Tax=Moorena producens PAL-8-15-08-1 TaxID=1458985 RepID=A0A1D8TSI7_9CYAN|nr:acyl-CoA dehydrogenase family protein [Moorena producens]AOX00599.1 acyl-CoA dehydrogenase [Moorena producens PAL-8-15-08-1]
MQVSKRYPDNDQQSLLETAESYLRESVAPLASEIDSAPEVLREALKGMSVRTLLGLRIPKSWGGLEVSSTIFGYFQQLVARYSGALAFLQMQHQSAGAMIAYSENESLKQQYLPKLAQGQVLVGIGFSQVRRTGNPLVKAIPVDGGYQISGKVPWVTGFSLFQEFVIGAVLPDGRELYGMVPLTPICQDAGGTITFSKPMALGAMQSTNTVSATLMDWLLPEERVVSIAKAGAIHGNDQKKVLSAGFLALGCAQAGLDIVEAAAKTKQLDFLYNAFESLNGELIRCQTAMLEAAQGDSQTFEQRLQLRTWAINLAGRCAQAAVTVSSGAANYKHHAAQRVYREALVFTVSGQTTAMMEGTLARLVNVSCG